ncbi:type II toxin-antitoxin system RelE/ParE family toxin [candidate division KSB1 bacterium]|nr:type II toxin-antitoxin system RelE/ParE family toxin [candidate division KSB1 bacterium]
MRQVIISPEAENDLKEIGIFTENNWGRKQRKKYLAQLVERMHFLAAHRALVKRRYDLPDSPYCFHEGKHVIFFREVPQGIEIIRVLHEVMDFSLHL